MKWIIALLILLVACSTVEQTAMTKPSTRPIESTVYQQPEPAAAQEQVSKQPVLESEVKAPVETAPAQSEPAEPQVQLSCDELCAQDCEKDAQNACKQQERSQCKSQCGDIIDPSACSQACSFLHQSASCRTQFEQFCKAKCVERCN